MCRKLFYKMLQTTFSDPEQFKMVHAVPEGKKATEEAMQWAKKEIEQNSKKHGIHGKFKFTKGKKAPHAFVFPTNKSDHPKIKTRILFPHFSHPGKDWGRKIGRALTKLIELAKQLLPTWAMLDIRDMKTYAQDVQNFMQTGAGSEEGTPRKVNISGPPRQPRPTRLFELDVREMFPKN